MANISKIKLPSGVTYDVVDEKSGYITSASLPTKTSQLTNDSGYLTSYTDTKNTAGSTNTNSKIYLIGATEQSANPQTYSNSKLYFSGGLYSDFSHSSTGLRSTISQNYISGIELYAGSAQSPIGSTKINVTDSKTSISGKSGANDAVEYISVGSNGNVVVTGLVTPTNDTDAATKKYVDDSIPTVPTITLNGSSTTSPSFYAPTTAGTSGYVLKSNGSGAAPTWVSAALTDTKLSVENLTTNYNSSVTHYVVLRSGGTAANTGYISNITFTHTGGSTSSQGYAHLKLGNETATGTNGNSTGRLTLYASNNRYTQINTNTLTYNNIITLPSSTGTIALTSDIPTKTSQLTNDSGFITSYTETDPTVPAWAKASTKPTYTASEVGALPDTTTIPTKTSQLTNDSGFVKTDTNTTYTLSNALSSHKFTSTLTAGGSGSGTSTATITFAAGSNVTLTDDTTNKKITIAATDTKLQVAAITSGTIYYPIVGTGTTTATRQFDTTGFIYKGTNGTTSATGHSLLTLGNATATGTANNKQGRLELYGIGAYSIMITPGYPTAARTITLPNATGTLALTSDLNNYLPLTGGSVTGPVTFNDSITIDDATVGSLVVNGSASFTNNISANTINGVEVGSSPKFTDESIVDLIYPVGSIYMSVNSASPATLFGGTWTQLKDMFLLGAGDTYSIGNATASSPTKDGGAATVTLTANQTGVHQHTHSFTQPTVNGGAVTNGITGGSHHHVLDRNTRNNSGSESGYGYTTQNGKSTPDSTLDSTHTHTLPAHAHSVSGGAVGNTTAASATEAHNNMPPYLTVYMWKRTA